MTTKILIINRALTKLGSERLMSETDNNAASRAIEAVYDGVLDNLLRVYRWSFAIKRAALPALVEKPVHGYQFEYQLPADCLRIDMVTDNIHHDWRCEWHMPVPRYQVEGRKILADIESPLYLRYGARMTDPSIYDSAFAEAFACALAVEICESITQSSTKKQAALQAYTTAISQARQVSAIERPPIQQQETSWYTSRL
ncbi:hypothetical protein [Erwinia phyllosphaerae]|uniref:hypothetical protein n=1 Tax=Erwinia phyllosphaerae TaxID=2853256 RepID=UPI001FEE6197|nr:hypothetical protein [Erwinia phyllosphaerae]MBV4365920.1 hypothetical protein [Erwinia phyllosphaerae]